VPTRGVPVGAFDARDDERLAGGERRVHVEVVGHDDGVDRHVIVLRDPFELLPTLHDMRLGAGDRVHGVRLVRARRTDLDRSRQAEREDRQKHRVPHGRASRNPNRAWRPDSSALGQLDDRIAEKALDRVHRF
jgi:hypothetical protein